MMILLGETRWKLPSQGHVAQPASSGGTCILPFQTPLPLYHAEGVHVAAFLCKASTAWSCCGDHNIRASLSVSLNLNIELMFCVLRASCA